MSRTFVFRTKKKGFPPEVVPDAKVAAEPVTDPVAVAEPSPVPDGNVARNTNANPTAVERRWTKRLGHFTPISQFFLEHYNELRPRPDVRGMNSTEAMVVIQLMSFKWDERAPFPTVGSIAKRMGLSARAVRAAIRNVEDNGYIRRDPMPHGGPNRYVFEGLFTALERLMDETAEKAA